MKQQDNYHTTVIDETTEWQAGGFSRVSWGAIFAGVVIAFVVHLALSLLGIAIGLGVIDFATDEAPLSGLGWGGGIWLTFSTIVALLAGGWTAGRMAGFPGRKVGLLHGVVTWALVSFFSFITIVSGAGAIIGGALSIVQTGTQALGEGIVSIATNTNDQNNQAQGVYDADQIREEVFAILRQTDKEALLPENLKERVQEVAETVEETASDVLRTPTDAEVEIDQAVEQLMAQGREVIEEVDREAFVNVLVARTDMTAEEARQTATQYEEVIQQAKARLNELGNDVQSEMLSAADSVKNAVVSASLWAFISMLLGALAGGFGGALGVPRTVPVMERKEFDVVS